MAYSEADVRQFADEIVETVDLVKTEGFLSAAANGPDLVESLIACSNEFKDTDAFITHLISQFADILGDRLVNYEVADDEPADEDGGYEYEEDLGE